MMRRGADRQAGFALVESIAVLALSGLVLLTLVIATDLVSRNSAAAARTANAIETLSTGLSAVRRDLEGARFIRVGVRPEDLVLFSGGAQAVALAVADDGTGTHDGESLVLIQARSEDGRNALVRSSARWLPGTTGFGAVAFSNHALLVSGPWRYKFSYADPEATERWRNTWTATTRMPAAIRLEVLDDAGQRVVPALTVRLHVNSGGCADAAQVDCAERDEALRDPNQPQDDSGQPREEGNEPNVEQ